MKRRALLLRTVSGAVSAGVFSAAGWLMGTRTLTMSGWVWQTLDQCNPEGDCNCIDSSGASCNWDELCPSEPKCYRSEWKYMKCCLEGNLCKLGTRQYPCNSCSNCPR